MVTEDTLEVYRLNPTQAYPKLVTNYIREKYDIDAELAIQRQKDTKVEDWEEYNAYCEECKVIAKTDLHILESDN